MTRPTITGIAALILTIFFAFVFHRIRRAKERLGGV